MVYRINRYKPSEKRTNYSEVFTVFWSVEESKEYNDPKKELLIEECTLVQYASFSEGSNKQ